MTHPFWHQRGATLIRQVKVPAEGETHLLLMVAAAPEGQWVLRVFADLKLVARKNISRETSLKIDLTPFAGKEIPILIENYAYDMKNDFGYWKAVKIVTQ